MIGRIVEPRTESLVLQHVRSYVQFWGENCSPVSHNVVLISRTSETSEMITCKIQSAMSVSLTRMLPLLQIIRL